MNTSRRWSLRLVLLHALIACVLLLTEPRVPRSESVRFRAPAAPSEGIEFTRFYYNLPAGTTFIAERTWTVAYRPIWYRLLVLADLPTIVATSLLSFVLFPVLHQLEPWLRSWLTFAVLLLVGSLQWAAVGSLFYRVAGLLRSPTQTKQLCSTHPTTKPPDDRA